MDLILLLKAAILGIVEGVTEFIPVSSTGHLILSQDWLGFTGRKENAFIIFIQLGAILAVVWLYRMKFIDVVLNLHRKPEARSLVVNLIVATLPAVVIGLPTEKWIEAHLFRPIPVALAFALGGLAILVIESWYKTPSVESVDHVPLKKAFGVGVIQVLAILFPGISRSGATIMGGLVLGLSRTAATEFSFFLAIPAMLGASLIKLIKVRDLMSPADIPVFTVGFVVAFFFALLVIRGLLSYVSRKSFVPFAWYRIFFGVLILILYWNRSAF
jgi:undecaprenyl-diphosphatase